MRVWLGAAVLMAALPAHAEIYRCIIDGTPTFQDTPCGDTAQLYQPEANVSSMVSRPVAGELSLRYQQRIQREKREAAQSRQATVRNLADQNAERQRLQAARRAGMPAEGMSESRVTTMYGRPDEVTNSQHVGRTCKHLRWYDPYRSVDVCNGKVTYSYRTQD